MDAVMKGDFTELPGQVSNVVKIFLSSTFGGRNLAGSAY